MTPEPVLSTPAPLGTTVGNGAGGYRVDVIVPLGTRPGAHTVVTAGGGAQAVARLTVVAKPGPALAAPASTHPAPPARGLSPAGEP